MWHVSNEYACHNLPCYCDTCAVAFRRWLERRYTTLDALNDAWGTAFWSQRYTAWDDILPPRRTTTFNNPTHVLDYHRFGSDTLLDFYRAEHEVIRRHSPQVPVTTNFMTLSHFRLLDYPTGPRSRTSSAPTTTSSTRSRTRRPSCPSAATSPAAWPAGSPGCSWSTRPVR